MVRSKTLKWYNRGKGMKVNIIKLPVGYELANVSEIKSPHYAKRRQNLIVAILKKKLKKVA